MRVHVNISTCCVLLFAGFGVSAGAQTSAARAQAAAQTPVPAKAQDARDTGPAAALVDALTAACRADDAQFAKSLTADNTTAFNELPAEQRKMLLQRFSLSSEAGKPLRSADQNGQQVLRCESPAGIAEFRLGEARLRENLAFVPVTVVEGAAAEFGMVREGGKWKVLSLGLLLIDIHELSAEWSEQETLTKEDAAVNNLQTLADAVLKYRSAFGYLPDTLVQLGPGPTDTITPDLASLVGTSLAAGDDSGYSFRYRMISLPDAGTPEFEMTATPDSYGTSGKRSFFRDSGGNIHAADRKGQPAGPDDPTMKTESAAP
jgi:hypothetical protein